MNLMQWTRSPCRRKAVKDRDKKKEGEEWKSKKAEKQGRMKIGRELRSKIGGVKKETKKERNINSNTLVVHDFRRWLILSRIRRIVCLGMWVLQLFPFVILI